MSQPYNQVKASSLAGVILDCDIDTGLKIGGGTATDNTAALNAFLATASATNPIELILDGGTLVTGLVIATAGYTTITGIGWKSGIYIKSGSNSDAINNGSFPFGPTSTPALTGTAPAQQGSVAFRNFKINGNRGNGATGNSNSGDPRGVTGIYWYSNITLYNLAGVHIEDMYLFDSPTYGIRITNCSALYIKNNDIFNPNTTATPNNDGIHINQGTDIYIGGTRVNNNLSDDAIALNQPEGYSNSTIDRVVIEGNTLVNVFTGLRVYSYAEGGVGSFVFANNIVRALEQGVLIGDGTHSTGDYVRKGLISGNIFTFLSGAASGVNITEGCGDIEVVDCTVLSPLAAMNFVSVGANTTSSLTVKNCRIYRSTVGSNTSSIGVALSATSTVGRLTIDGFHVVNEQGQTYAAIADLLSITAGGVISNLFIGSMDSTLITALANSYAGITAMSGPGVFPSSQVLHQTAAYTVLPADGLITTTGAFSITLPPVAYAGERHTFKKLDASTTLTLVGTIDGSTTNTLTMQFSKLTIEFDGTAWWSV